MMGSGKKVADYSYEFVSVLLRCIILMCFGWAISYILIRENIKKTHINCVMLLNKKKHYKHNSFYS